MGENQPYHINLSAPNLVNLCIDKRAGGEIFGRMYHCYQEESQEFTGILQMLSLMEQLYDRISFPQASTKTRYFIEPETCSRRPLGKKKDQMEIIRHKGKLGTFITFVQYRQNSTWQGKIAWMERKKLYHFSSTLEFIRLMDNALDPGDK